jgi:hypothetical protein
LSSSLMTSSSLSSSSVRSFSGAFNSHYDAAVAASDPDVIWESPTKIKSPPL